MKKSGKVFMLEDDLSSLDIFRELFNARGYDVFATDNSYKFLLYAREIRPDIFILDVNMPQTGGWEILRLLKREGVLQDIPVVMFTLTNYAVDPDIAEGAAHFLRKPLDLEKLFDIVGSYCLGGRRHDVLLLEDYVPEISYLEKSIYDKKLSCFLVHDVTAARKYLNKNKPQAVCLVCDDERYTVWRPQLNHNNIFRLAATQSIDEAGALVNY